VRVLIEAVGSHGDTLPFIGLAAALARRGHDARLHGNALFAPLAADAGLRFTATSTEQEARAFLDDPRATESRAGMRLIAAQLPAQLERSHAALARDLAPGGTVLVGSSLAFAARCFAEARGVPFVAVHMAPSLYRSEHLAPRVSPFGDLSRWPRWSRRLAWLAMDRGFLDPVLGVPLNRVRAQLGLAPVARVMHRWIHAATVNVGAFPGWFAPRQPDWPADLVTTGFPMYDGRAGQPLPEALAAFLDAGAPPVVFTAGTANASSHRFYGESALACARLRRRGVLVAQRRDQLPARLPDGVVHAAHAPFSALFPRAAAVVHHGGIGTLAQALAAGVPQLIQPMAYDQFDNALRARRLGVALELPRRRYRASAAAALIDALVSDTTVRTACTRVAAELARDGGIEALCDAVLRAGPDGRRHDAEPDGRRPDTGPQPAQRSD
jgi:rhamnosyltransferase subunit B